MPKIFIKVLISPQRWASSIVLHYNESEAANCVLFGAEAAKEVTGDRKRDL